jgi:hypothetical protein
MHAQSLIFNRWTTKELRLLLNSSCTNFYTVIYNMITCQAGKLFEIDNDEMVILEHRSAEASRQSIRRQPEIEFMRIPIPLAQTEEDGRITRFMQERGISSYTLVNIGEMMP